MVVKMGVELAGLNEGDEGQILFECASQHLFGDLLHLLDRDAAGCLDGLEDAVHGTQHGLAKAAGFGKFCRQRHATHPG